MSVDLFKILKSYDLIILYFCSKNIKELVILPTQKKIVELLNKILVILYIF